jgi:CRP-like cAMP-binding protein
MPEDHVVEYGSNEKSVYFIAQGKLLVTVMNHLRAKSQVGELEEGQYFGEVSILYGSKRTADV